MNTEMQSVNLFEEINFSELTNQQPQQQEKYDIALLLLTHTPTNITYPVPLLHSNQLHILDYLAFDFSFNINVNLSELYKLEQGQYLILPNLKPFENKEFIQCLFAGEIPNWIPKYNKIYFHKLSLEEIQKILDLRADPSYGLLLQSL